MTEKELLHEIPKGILKWYPFATGRTALYISSDTVFDKVLTESLTEDGLAVDIVDAAVAEGVDTLGERPLQYDYIIIADAVERSLKIESVFRYAFNVLAPDGIFFVCAQNRFGIRYFCGDKDPFTERSFDSIENYMRISAQDRVALEGKLRSKAELTEALLTAGFERFRFYSVFPEVTAAHYIFAEDFEPEEELSIRVLPQYNDHDSVFMQEEILYTDLIKNGFFHKMANGYLIECVKEAELANAKQITIAMDRGIERSACTIIRRDDKVEKRAIYDEAGSWTYELKENSEYLSSHGIKVIDGEILNGSYVMPYVKGTPLMTYFVDSAKRDKAEFLQEFDIFWKQILASSEHISYEDVDWEHFDPAWEEKKIKNFDREKWRKFALTDEGIEKLGPILRRGYLDFVLLNGFKVGGEFVFFDQEMYLDSVPAKAILLRSIDFLYQDPELRQIILRKELIERYDIEPCERVFRSFITHYLSKLQNDDILLTYHLKRRHDAGIIHANRQRMNFSAREYQALFVDVFKNIGKKKLFVFGSGNYAERFIELFGDEYEISGVLDNNKGRWGDEISSIKIMAPSILENMEPDKYKVVICIRDYTGVLKQIKKMGAKNIGIYTTDASYERERPVLSVTAYEDEKKKYHIGYVAGVFDLFHMGHLNLLRRAKEQCSYLIAGVVSDENAGNDKGGTYIPFEERIEIVRACRYVDEAVAIPSKYCDTRDAWQKFHFDVQFSGSDYEDDPEWLAKRDFLREHGAELVFFPYTESTSSSKIKAAINKGC